MNGNLASIMAQLDGLTDDERRSLTDFLSNKADDHFMKELEEMFGTAVVRPDHDSHSADDDGEDPGEADKGERYSLDEWIRKETEAYGDYLSGMDAWDVIEEYHRQGGEDVVYFDPESGDIVVKSDCPKCGGRMVGDTEVSQGGIRTSEAWCTGCGYVCGETMYPDGVGSGGEDQLSPEELQRRKAERESR